MNVMQIGSDRSIFQKDSPSAKRMQAYAERLGNLDIIVFSLRKDHLEPIHINSRVWVYPTNSLTKAHYVGDAIRIGRTIQGIEIVSAQDPFEAGFAGLKIARYLKVPLHLQIHTDIFSPAFVTVSLLNRVRVLLARYVLPKAAHVRVVSERIKISLQKNSHVKSISVLPIFVDIEKFAALAHHPHTRFSKNLLWVGRLEKEKNPALALEVFAAARSKEADLGLTIVGSGSMKKTLIVFAKRLEVSSWVEFIETTSNIASCYAAADLLLVTSYYEGYGLAIVEALAAHVPVLATDVGIAKEAGALITTPEHFSRSLTEWVEHGPREGHLQGYPYRSAAQYIDAYVDDLRSCFSKK